MEERSTPAVFFQSMFDIYESVPEKRDIIINQVVIFGEFAKFLEFVSVKVQSHNLPVSSARALIDFVADYMFLYKDGFNASHVTEYLSLLLKLISLKTLPSSFEKYSHLLRISFKALRSYDHAQLFKEITALPIENCLIPLAAFAVVNPQYLARSFRFVLGQVDPMFKGQKGLIWVVAFSLLLTAEEKVELEKTHLFAAFNTAFGNATVPLCKKIQMLLLACKYLPSDTSIALVNSHFRGLINAVTPNSTVDDICDAILLAKAVLELLQVETSSTLDKKKVSDLVFVNLSMFYKPVRKLNDALTEFCSQIDKTEMESLTKASVKSGMVKGCLFFLISRYPTSETLPVLLEKQDPADEKAQYAAVFYYLSHNSVHFRFLPRLFELLEPNDLSFLDDLFQKKPDLYCLAVIKYLAHAKAVEKVSMIAKFLSGMETLPLVASPFCQAAFAVATVLRIHSKQDPKHIRLLIEYLHACAVYSRGMKVKQTKHKTENETLSLTNEEVALLKNRADDDVFHVDKVIEYVSACGFCQSQVIRDWCVADESLCKWYTEYGLNRIQHGDVEYTVLLSHLSRDKTLIRNCIESIRSDPYLLVFFFSSCACCSPAEALSELKAYVLTEHEQQSTSFFGRLFTTPTKTDTISDRQTVARRVIIGTAPFVPCNQQLLDVLLAAIPDQASNRSFLVCEAVTAVCERLTHRELLQSLLEKMLSQHSKHGVKPFVTALTAIIKCNESRNTQLLTRVCNVWVQLLLTNEVPLDSQFEKAFFDPYYENAGLAPYLKEVEKAMLMHSDCVALFQSLERTMNLKVFDLSQFNRFVTVFISNCLSSSKEISDFCVSVLQQLHQISIGIDTCHGSRFSFEYLSGVRPFLTQLAGKFNTSNSLTLFEALLDIVRSNADSSCSIVLFSLFLVGKDPKSFIKSKIKFVPKIVSVCSKMKRKTDYPVMFYFFRILDLMATADTTLFYNQFLLTDENEFSNLYLHRFVHSPAFSDAIAAALLKQLQDLTSFNGKRSSDFVIFPRLIMLLKYHVKYFVTESTPDDRMASILFGLLLLLSSINNMRCRSIPFSDTLHALLKVFRVFGDNTGIDLSNGQQLDISSDEQFCQTLSNFIAFMHLMSYSLADAFVDKLKALQKTPHSSTACVISASLLRLYSSAASENGKKLSEKLLAFYLGLLKQESYPEIIVVDSITRASPALTFHSLLGFTADNLEKLLNVTLDATSRATKAGISRCIDMLLNVLRAGNAKFLTAHTKSILKCLTGVIKSHTMELGAIPMLNVIGELTKKVPEPSWFLKPDAISFHSLIPLTVDPSSKVSQRALGIFSFLIFNKESGFDAQLLFSSLMSIFCAIERDPSNYVAMALHLIEHLERSQSLTYSNLELLGHVMDPVLSVGDANCNLGLQTLMNFLRKQSRSPNEEIATKAMSLMAHFATPKQRLQRRAIQV